MSTLLLLIAVATFFALAAIQARLLANAMRRAKRPRQPIIIAAALMLTLVPVASALALGAMTLAGFCGFVLLLLAPMGIAAVISWRATGSGDVLGSMFGAAFFAILIGFVGVALSSVIGWAFSFPPGGFTVMFAAAVLAGVVGWYWISAGALRLWVRSERSRLEGGLCPICDYPLPPADSTGQRICPECGNVEREAPLSA